MIFDRFKTLRKSKASIQREGQARQGCLSVCAQGLCKDAKPTTHTQTLTLRIFPQFITAAHKPQTPRLPYERFAGFTKCSKSPTLLPFNERSVCFASALSPENCQHPCLLMNALFVLRPAKLWEFNFGHPCPPSKKGEVLLLGQAEPTMVGIVMP